MAKIKMGALMTDIRGSAGGSVFARNGGGAYMRNKSTPLNPQTTYQSGVRSIFGAISQGWSQLDEEVREQFNSAVDNYSQTDVFGDEQVLSGKALYQKLNQNLLLADQPLLNGVPVNQQVPALDNLRVEFDVAQGGMTLNVDGTETNGFTFIYATPTVSSGTNFIKNRLRLIRVEPGQITDLDIQDDYQNRFGSIISSGRIGVAVRGVAPQGLNGPLNSSFVEFVTP